MVYPSLRDYLEHLRSAEEQRQNMEDDSHRRALRKRAKERAKERAKAKARAHLTVVNNKSEDQT